MKVYRAAAIGVGVVLAVGVGAKLAIRHYYSDGTPYVDVTLSMRNGKCTSSEPALLGGTYDDGVTWRVKNADCPDQYIQMDNFRPYKKGVPGEKDKKVIKPDPAMGGPISSTATQPFLLTAQIKKWQWWNYQLFKYDISLSTTPNNFVLSLDPDIDIWP